MTIDLKKIFAKEIAEAFAKIGVSGRGSKTQIAKICGISSAAVGAWFRDDDRKQPSIENMVHIAEVTHTSLDRLIRGKKANDAIPLLGNYDALSSVKHFQEIDSHELLSDVLHKEGEQYLALIARDDSMMQLNNPQNYYPKGAILVFRLDNSRPRHGDLVLVKIQKNHKEFFMFRQFLENAGEEYFVPFNPTFEKVSDFDSYEIIGFFVYQILK